MFPEENTSVPAELLPTMWLEESSKICTLPFEISVTDPKFMLSLEALPRLILAPVTVASPDTATAAAAVLVTKLDDVRFRVAAVLLPVRSVCESSKTVTVLLLVRVSVPKLTEPAEAIVIPLAPISDALALICTLSVAALPRLIDVPVRVALVPTESPTPDSLVSRADEVSWRVPALLEDFSTVCESSKMVTMPGELNCSVPKSVVPAELSVMLPEVAVNTASLAMDTDSLLLSVREILEPVMAAPAEAVTLLPA